VRRIVVPVLLVLLTVILVVGAIVVHRDLAAQNELIASLVRASNRQPPATPIHVAKWEYKIASLSDATFDAEVNLLGTEGWELVFARRARDGEGAAESVAYEMVFRRPLADVDVARVAREQTARLADIRREIADRSVTVIAATQAHQR
jgi:hypothetical protein